MLDEEKINEELEQEPVKSDTDEYKANWQRALADYRNLQKETAAMRSQWAQMSEENILQNFIPVYENFKKAFNTDFADANAMDDADKKWRSWKQGIEYIMKQFGDVLKSYNVQEIKTVGEQFDPMFHEAISEEESGEAGIILKELEGGYKMGDKVIKPARVIISK
ncbi:MAG: nucleotide exchange factor GrpE [Patescibacteria group bacterium]